MPHYDTKWWGWGDAGKRAELSAGARERLREELGIDPAAVSPPAPLESFELAEASPVPGPVVAAVGREFVFDGLEDRLRHAAGSGYPDLVRLRQGAISDAPDAVVLPADAAQVAAVLEACTREGVAVVPFGGGTSVVGGVDPVRGEHSTLISLDLRRLKLVELDATSLTARLGPGLRGPEAETALAGLGTTLGHYPQSYEYATIGGFAATRSAGQASCGYGRFDDMVTAIELQAPTGAMRTLQTPHTAAGPSLRELVVGSEGTLGVITEVTCRVHQAPELEAYEGWMAADFAAGREIVRTLAQRGEAPDVLRLSDEEETRQSLAMSATDGLAKRALDTYLKVRRREGGCLIICGWKGLREHVRRRRSTAAKVLRRGGAVALGSRAGDSWQRGRYEGPYLRDELLGAGVFVETLETSHTWSRLEHLYTEVGSAIRQALAAGGTAGIVMCHISHAYADGASLYYTFLARSRAGQEIEQWREVKTAACEAIVRAEGTITHHHAVGRDHAPHMEAEVGALGIDALRAVKERLDPAGIMNPGKLLP
ncbi:MAG: FAD-binding oxidoreductase [Solirubrobacterales bacterium]|nr:FAD-binding oxidoreductase [Solirubrobacterales bacterium]